MSLFLAAQLHLVIFVSRMAVMALVRATCSRGGSVCKDWFDRAGKMVYWLKRNVLSVGDFTWAKEGSEPELPDGSRVTGGLHTRCTRAARGLHAGCMRAARATRGLHAGCAGCTRAGRPARRLYVKCARAARGLCVGCAWFANAGHGVCEKWEPKR